MHKEDNKIIEIKNKQILIDGKATIITSGEIHYFRLDKEEWQDRINKLKATGCNAVSSYIPWICHEPCEGMVDLEGKYRPELDVGGFIDLCKENGLYFLARPGPFIMAEIKNEGLPSWIYKKHKEIIPICWDNKITTTKTIDYLAPEFLQEVHNWYKEVMKVIAPRIYTKGGNIIGVQLDNEVGMLSWVSNCPDFTENALIDFAKWLKGKYDEKTLRTRYPFDFDMEKFIINIRSPKEEYALELFRDIGHFMRNRFARYIAQLRSYAEEFGVKDIPFFVNIHGTSNNHGFTFPVGISQLYESYTQESGYIAGSDLYLGNLTMDNFQDLYIINKFMDAVNNYDQPLTSLEFECGDGNYGNNCGGRYETSAIDLKTRVCISQGNKLLNYYLFSGGKNYILHPLLNDGNDRIGTTGEMHGFAAPVSPEGKLNYTYHRMARIIKTIMAVSDKLATMVEEYDNIALAFIPDYFMTEYYYEKSEKMKAIINNLTMHRAYQSWETAIRSLLLANYRLSSVNIQKEIDHLKTTVLILLSARYMDSKIQTKLVEFLKKGGKIFLYGEVPQMDMEGNKCTILQEAIKVKEKEIIKNSDDFYLSIYADGWASPRPEVRTDFIQTLIIEEGEAIFRLHGTNEVCGFETNVSKGKIIGVTANYICDINFIKEAMGRLGVTPMLYHDCNDNGIIITSTVNDNNERFLHLINLDDYEKSVYIYKDNKMLFDGNQISIEGKDGIMIPLNVYINEIKIIYSTAEIIEKGEGFIKFRLTQSKDIIVLETLRQIQDNNDYEIYRNGEIHKIISKKNSKIDNILEINYK
ncbi:MAG: beta-galactosidase [Thermoanaerobacteraceae bacterium]